jgi:hypothetical protein
MKEEKLSEYKDAKNNVCNHCNRTSINGYDLICYQDRNEQTSLSLHFCSTHCLSRWVGERGWLYELYLKGIHDKSLSTDVRKENHVHEILGKLMLDS